MPATPPLTALSDDEGLFRDTVYEFAHREIRALLLDKAQAETMYAGVVNDKSFGGAFVSGDGGSRWLQINRGLNGSDVLTLAQDANDQLVAGTNNGIFRLEPSTRTWTSIFTTSVWRPYVTDLHIEGENWFAGTTTGLLYSHDGGRSWQVQHNTGKEAVTMVSTSSSRIAAAGYHTLLTSHDDGRNWVCPISPAHAPRISELVMSPRSMMRSASRSSAWNSSERRQS